MLTSLNWTIGGPVEHASIAKISVGRYGREKQSRQKGCGFKACHVYTKSIMKMICFLYRKLKGSQPAREGAPICPCGVLTPNRKNVCWHGEICCSGRGLGRLIYALTGADNRMACQPETKRAQPILYYRIRRRWRQFPTGVAAAVRRSTATSTRVLFKWLRI